MVAETIVAFHGTSQLAATSIRAHGFRPSNPFGMVELVAQHLGLDPAPLWDSVELEFVRARRDLDHVFFTLDRSVAEQHRIPEVVQDAFRAAHRLTGGGRRDRDAWVVEAAQRLLGGGKILQVQLPWDVIGAHAFGRVISFQEWREWGEPADLHSFSIPISSLGNPGVEVLTP